MQPYSSELASEQYPLATSPGGSSSPRAGWLEYWPLSVLLATLYASRNRQPANGGHLSLLFEFLLVDNAMRFLYVGRNYVTHLNFNAGEPSRKRYFVG